MKLRIVTFFQLFIIGSLFASSEIHDQKVSVWIDLEYTTFHQNDCLNIPGVVRFFLDDTQVLVRSIGPNSGETVGPREIRLFPNRQYTFKITSEANIESGMVWLSVPSQYELVGDSVIAVPLACNGITTVEKSIRVERVERSDPSMQIADYHTSQIPTQVDWKFGLGVESTGNDIGSLNWVGTIPAMGTTIPAKLFNLNNLVYHRRGSQEVDVKRTSGKIRQIRTYQTLVDVIPIGSNEGFKIEYYFPEVYTNDPFDSTFNEAGTYSKNSGATPFARYTIIPVGSTGYRLVKEINNDFEGTSFFASEALVYEVSLLGSDPVEWRIRFGSGTGSSGSGWTLNTGAMLGEHQIKSEEDAQANTITQRIRSYGIKTSSGYTNTLISEYQRIVDTSQGNHRIQSRTSAPDFYTQPLLETSYDYESSNPSLVRHSENPEGWIGYNYTDKHYVSKIFHPFQDSPSTPQVSEQGFSGRWTTIEYANATTVGGYTVTNDVNQSYWRPALVRDYIGSTEIGRTVNAYTFGSLGNANTIIEETRRFSESSQSLIHKHQRYSWNQSQSANNIYRNLPIWEEGIDGTKSYHSYGRGILNSTKCSPSPSFTDNSGGTGWKQVTFIGVNRQGPDVDNTAVDAYTHGGEFTSFYLIRNKSKRITIYRQDLSQVMVEEVYLSPGNFQMINWVYQKQSPFGHVLYSKDMRGNVSEVVNYVGGRALKIKDETGTVFKRVFDVLGRVIKSSKLANDGINSLESFYDIDVHHRIREERTESTEIGNETLTTANTYDLSGFLSHSVLSCGKEVNYERVPVGGKYTIVKKSEGSSPVRESITARYLDGTIKSVTGNAVVESLSEITLNSQNGFLSQVQEGPEIGGHRNYMRQTFDWLGRLRESNEPSMQENRLGLYENTVLYQYYSPTGTWQNRGKLYLTRVVSDSTATNDLRFINTYGFTGGLFRSGQKANTSSTLSTASMDFIEEYQTRFVSDSEAWWLESSSKVYPNNNSSSNPIFTTRTRERMTGFSGNLRQERQIWTDHKTAAVPRTRVQTFIDRNNRLVTESVWNPPWPDSTPDPAVRKFLNGLLEETISPAGVKTGYYYDGLERLVEVLEGNNTRSTLTDIDFRQVFEYQGNTRLIKAKYLPETGTSTTLWKAVEFEYEDCGSGLVSSSTSSYMRRVDNSTWSGSLSQTTETTYYRYNTRNQRTHVWGSGESPQRFDYDAYGRVVEQSTYREGSGWSASTFPSTAFASSERSKTVFSYDPLTGNLVEKTYPTSSVWTDPSAPQPSPDKESYTYDWMNRQVEVTNARGLKKEYQFANISGRLMKEIYLSQGDNTPDVTYTYDRVGRIATVTDAMGTRTMGYNGTSNYRPLALRRETLDSTVYGTNNVITHDYNLFQKRSQWNLGTTSTPAAVAKNTFTYSSSNGRLSSINNGLDWAYTTYASQVEAPVGFRVHSGSGDYIHNHNTIGSDRKEISESRVFVGNLAGSQVYDLHSSINFTRNNAGKIEISQRSGNHWSVYGRATSGACDDTGVSGTGLWTNHFYNDRGELVLHSEWTENPSSQKQRVNDRNRFFDYDNAGNRVHSANKQQSPQPSNFSANNNNQYVEVRSDQQSFISGITPDYRCVDWYYRLQENDWQPEGRPGSGEHFHLEYESADQYSGSSPVDFSRHLYSITDQDWVNLIHRASPQKPLYDADGNMTYDGARVGATTTSSFANHYTYDTENRLIRIEDGTAGIISNFTSARISFEYDYRGRRSRQVVEIYDVQTESWTTHREWVFIYDGFHLIGQYAVQRNSSGVITGWQTGRTYYWGLDISGSYGGAGGIGGLWMIRDHVANRHYVPGYDGMGNVLMLYSLEDKRVVSEYEYDPFGQLTRQTGWVKVGSNWVPVDYDPVDNPFRYQTKWWVNAQAGLSTEFSGHGTSTAGSVFDLYDYGLRWYHPRHGRFINRDPIREQGGMNIYAYVGNDPINGRDYLGLCTITQYYYVTETRVGDRLVGRSIRPDGVEFGRDCFGSEGRMKLAENEGSGGADKETKPAPKTKDPEEELAQEENWSKERCDQLAQNIDRFTGAVAGNIANIEGMLADSPGARRHVQSALDYTTAAGSLASASEIVPAFRNVMQRGGRFGAGVQGFSSAVGAAGLVSNFYNLTDGIANAEKGVHGSSGQIVSGSAGIALWGTMAIGASESVAVIRMANPYVAGASLAIFASVEGYSAYTRGQSNRQVAGTIDLVHGHLDSNSHQLQSMTDQYNQNCK